MAFTLTFGEVESALANLHSVASENRTKFQARLRKFQRLGVPAGVKTGSGVAGRYGAGQVIETALALQFTELGLTPERIERVLRKNGFAIGNAVAMAARSLLENEGVEPWQPGDTRLLHMFLYFDPNSLRSLTDQESDNWDWAAASLFYAGAGIIRENIVELVTDHMRLSLINVTAVLGVLAIEPEFLEDAIDWAQALIDDDSEEEDLAFRRLMKELRPALPMESPGSVKSPADVLKESGLAENRVRHDADGALSVDFPGGLYVTVDTGLVARNVDGPDDIRAYVHSIKQKAGGEPQVALMGYVPPQAVPALYEDEMLYRWAYGLGVLLVCPSHFQSVANVLAGIWVDEDREARNGDSN